MLGFEKIEFISNEAVNKLEEYLKKSMAYYRLKIFEQITLAFSLLIRILVIGFFVLIGLIFIGIGVAEIIGQALNNLPLGYLIVGSFFILIAIIVIFLKQFIENKTITKFSEFFFD